MDTEEPNELTVMSWFEVAERVLRGEAEIEGLDARRLVLMRAAAESYPEVFTALLALLAARTARLEATHGLLTAVYEWTHTDHRSAIATSKIKVAGPGGYRTYYLADLLGLHVKTGIPLDDGYRMVELMR